MSGALVGAGLGLLAGTGFAASLARLPALRRPTLDDRLAPYLRDSAPPSRLLARDRTISPFPTLERLVAPLMADAVRGLERFLGGAGSVRRRLDQAGRDMTLDEFRSQQIIGAVGGLAVGLGTSLLLGARGSFSPVLLLLLSLSGAVAGLLLRDQLLRQPASEPRAAHDGRRPGQPRHRRPCLLPTRTSRREELARGDAPPQPGKFLTSSLTSSSSKCGSEIGQKSPISPLVGWWDRT